MTWDLNEVLPKDPQWVQDLFRQQVGKHSRYAADLAHLPPLLQKEVGEIGELAHQLYSIASDNSETPTRKAESLDVLERVVPILRNRFNLIQMVPWENPASQQGNKKIQDLLEKSQEAILASSQASEKAPRKRKIEEVEETSSSVPKRQKTGEGLELETAAERTTLEQRQPTVMKRVQRLAKSMASHVSGVTQYLQPTRSQEEIDKAFNNALSTYNKFRPFRAALAGPSD